MLKQIMCGVPQGSVLGPKLFLIYFYSISNKLKCILFADDTTIICSGNNLEQLMIETTTEINKLKL